MKNIVGVKPKVSLIIPVYNGSEFLHDAIRSALAQTYSNIEIIVVDDGSQDGGATEVIAREYGDSIRFIGRENGGVAAALNTAIAAMTGDYFSWLSHDDLYAPDKVEQEVDAILKFEGIGEETIIYCDYAVFSTTPESATELRMDRMEPEAFRYWLTIKNTLHGCTLLIPRRAFTEIGGFDETLRTTQDFDLWFRFAAHYQFRHIPKVLVYARSHDQQGSVKMASVALEEGNALLTRFMGELTSEDLKAGGAPNRLEAIVTIARSFWRRGFVSAARSASRLAYLARDDVAFPQQVFPLIKLMLSPVEMQLRKVLRSVLSSQQRVRIRAAFKRSTPTSNLDSLDLKQRFSRIYQNNVFGGHASRSGAGSDLQQTEVIRSAIPALLREVGAKSLLDAPCGDWHWMQNADFGLESYIGVDIVGELISINQYKFGNDRIRFECLDLTYDDLPATDVIFSRDCLVHLNYSDAMRVIGNFKRTGARFLLTTTFPNLSRNSELAGKHAFWRPLNMQVEPFNFPPPRTLINENCTEDNGKYKDKCLGLWSLTDIDTSAYELELDQV